MQPLQRQFFVPLLRLFGQVLAVILRKDPHHLLGEIAFDAVAEILRNRNDRDLFFFRKRGQAHMLFQRTRNAIVFMDQNHIEEMTLGVRQQLLILLAGVGLLLGSGNGFVGIDLIDLHPTVLRKFAACADLCGGAHFRLVI